MWSLGHDDSDVSLYARAEGSLVTLEQIRGAKTRAQLNELYVMNGTMIVTSDDPPRFLMAHKVTKPGGGSYLVHFAAEAGRRPSRDVVLTWQQLAAAESLEGVLHMVFGVLGGTFTHIASGVKMKVLRTVADADGESLGHAIGKQVDPNDPTREYEQQQGTIDGFLRESQGEAVPDAPAPPAPEHIDLSGFPAVVELFDASSLMTGTGVEVSVAEEFMNAVFLSEAVIGRAAVIKAAGRLDLLMAGKTTLRGGAGWRELRQEGKLSDCGAAAAGRLVRSQYFIQSPGLEATVKAVRSEVAEVASGSESDSSSLGGGSDDDLDGIDDVDSDSDAAPAKRKARAAPAAPAAATKKPKVPAAAATDLAAFVPRDSKLSALETARILFEEPSVRAAAQTEELPSAVAAAGREWRFELRANNALHDLLQTIGRSLVPAKPPKNEMELQMVAENIYDAVRKLKRTANSGGGGGGGGGGAGGGGAHGGGVGLGGSASRDEDADLDRKPDPPLDAKASQAAVRAATAASLAAGADGIKAAWDATGKDPVKAMRGVSDQGLRDELSRAVASNGKVYAPGETQLKRRHLPPIVHEMRGAMLELVVEALLACVDADRAGVMHMSRETAAPLAEAALSGSFSWAAFSKASREMLQDAAEPVGTVGEMAQTFVLIEAAWAAVLDGVFGVTRDRGLQSMGKLLGATAKLQANKLPQEQRALYQKKLLRWVNLVLDKYSEDTRAFRRGGQQMPCVADAMDAFAKVYDHVAGSATMASEMLKEWMPQLETRKGKPAAKLGAGGGGGGGGGGAPAPGGEVAAQGKEKKKHKKKRKKAPAAVAAESDDESEDDDAAPTAKKGGAGAPRWKDKPKMDAATFKAATESFRAQFPEHCNWYMFSKCNRSDSECKFKHEVPAAFADWAKGVGK